MITINSFPRLIICAVAAVFASHLGAGFAGVISTPSNDPALNNGSTSDNINGLTSQATASGGTKIRLRGGKMQTRMENGKMLLTGFRGGFAGGQVQMQGRVNPSAAVGEAQSLDAQFANVRVDKVLELLAPTAMRPTLVGLQLSGKLTGDWQGLTVSSVAKSLQGDFDVALGAGNITEHALLEKIAKATGIEELQGLSFESAKLTGTATHGQIKITNVEIAGPDFRLVANGLIDLQKDGLDMTFDLNVSQALAQKSTFYKMKSVLSLFKGSSKPANSTELVQIPKFSLVGSLRSPEVRFAEKQVASAPAVPQAPAPQVAAPDAKRLFSLAAAWPASAQ